MKFTDEQRAAVAADAATRYRAGETWAMIAECQAPVLVEGRLSGVEGLGERFGNGGWRRRRGRPAV